MSESVQVRTQDFGVAVNGSRDAKPETDVALPSSVLVYRSDGPFFFGAAEKLERALERMPLGIQTVVFRLGQVPFMDATGIQTFHEIIERFRKHGVRTMLCGIHADLRGSLRLGGILDLVGEGNICSSMSEVAERLRENRESA